MKVLYIPLDERPCNWGYPQMVAHLQPNLELVVPPLDLLGCKKQAADVPQLWQWLHSQIADCLVAILSIEMLVYGGLLPSRLHHHDRETLSVRLNQIRQLKQVHPALTILASNLIMRTPAYNSGEEEPDYYADYGEAIFRWGWLQDKQARQGLTEAETVELDERDRNIPAEYLTDYRQRRDRNLAVNQQTLDLVDEGTLAFLSIPQDDSALYGFTALDQQQIGRQIRQRRLQTKVHLYPGADEVGCTLLARAYGFLTGKQPQVYSLYSAVNGDGIVPLYEDRPLGESVKAHILAAGARVAFSPQTADFVLAINTPGKVMQEAWDNPIKDLTYTSHRSLRFFVESIGALLAEGKAVAIADVAFANGGETELVQLLDDAALWDGLLAYAGWNTNCNTLGTVLATAILGSNGADSAILDYNKIYHLLDGWAYQTVTRMEMVRTYLPSLGASYYDFNGQEPTINQEMARRMLAAWEETIRQSFQRWQIDLKVSSPWQRMFEVGLELTLRDRGSNASFP